MDRREFLKILAQCSAGVGASIAAERAFGMPIMSLTKSSNQKIYMWGQKFTNFGGTATAELNHTLCFPRNKWTDIFLCKNGAVAGFGYAKEKNGNIYCWGDNNYGQLGGAPGTIVGPFYPTPVLFDSVGTWTKISVGGSHVAAIKNDGTLWAWGNNVSGQLGKGDFISSVTPVPMSTAPGGTWVDVYCGNGQTFARNSSGVIYAVGACSTSGTLGTGATSSQHTFAQVVGGPWTTLAAGSSHVLAIHNNGSLWSWGFNSSGQLGIGNTINQTVPVQVGSAYNWQSISTANGGFSFAINNSNYLYAFGYNQTGQLGLGVQGTNVLNPTQVGASTWLKAVGGSDHALGIRSDNTLWAWGNNASYGTFGNGVNGSSVVPIQIGSKYFTHLWAYQNSSSALRK